MKVYTFRDKYLSTEEKYEFAGPTNRPKFSFLCDVPGNKDSLKALFKRHLGRTIKPWLREFVHLVYVCRANQLHLIANPKNAEELIILDYIHPSFPRELSDDEYKAVLAAANRYPYDLRRCPICGNLLMHHLNHRYKH